MAGVSKRGRFVITNLEDSDKIDVMLDPTQKEEPQKFPEESYKSQKPFLDRKPEPTCDKEISVDFGSEPTHRRSDYSVHYTEKSPHEEHIPESVLNSFQETLSSKVMLT